MSGTHLSAIRGHARRLGMTEAAYHAHVAAGEKWCTACKAWHPRGSFPRDRTRYDGLKAACLSSGRAKPRRPRDPDRERARHAVGYLVRCGRLPDPNTMPCADCGHVYGPGERRHEYDHFLGYGPEHALVVQPVCTTCHANRERARREEAA